MKNGLPKINIRRLGFNCLLLFASIFFGVFFSELAGIFIGLGNPLLYKEDPLVGYRLKPNQAKRRLKKSIVTTDSEGFRIDPNQKKDKSEIIVFVGDSVTYGGSYIDDSELFSSIYCADSRNLLCLNSGVNAWGTYNMGRFISNFSLYSERIPSKFILVILPGNDDRRNLMELSSLPYWSKMPKYPKAINELLNHALWFYIIPNLRSNEVKEEKNISKERLIIYQTIKHSWEDLDNYIKYSKSKVEVVLTPPKKWFDDYESNKSDIALYENYLAILSKNSKVSKTCNLYHYIKDDYSSKDYVDRVHLSKNGHKKWAKYIKSCLDY